MKGCTQLSSTHDNQFTSRLKLKFLPTAMQPPTVALRAVWISFTCVGVNPQAVLRLVLVACCLWLVLAVSLHCSIPIG